MPKLIIVPTPIGNLEDITFRAVRLLKEADFILAEDTRTTGILLKHYGIQNKLVAFHQFNEHKNLLSVIRRISENKLVALVSDAGTPGISDAGFLLVRECIQENIGVECLPGATAFVPALVSSGLPCESFVFEGFLPQKKGRKTKIEILKEEKRTLVFYESPHRLLKMLEEFAENFGGERKISVSRELTKIHEETFRGTISEALQYFAAGTIKGEFVIVVEGRKVK